MIYFLRDKDNNTIIETECWVKTDYNSDGTKHEYVEVSSSVNEKINEFYSDSAKNLELLFVTD